MTQLNIKSFPITVAPRQAIISHIKDAIQNNQFLPITTLNITMFDAYQQNKTLSNWLVNHAMFTPDGISISLLLLKQYRQWVPPYPGIDMVTDLLNQSNKLNIALIGATDNNLHLAKQYLQTSYPAHTICFAMNGYLPLSNYIDALKNQQPDLILVAKGCPKQDECIFDLSSALNRGVVIGVGGAFDVWSGQVKRAPHIYRKFGLEWLYRIISQPSRIIKFLSSIKWFFK